MTVYVDWPEPVVEGSAWAYGYACHMMADSTEELLTAADTIGLKGEWIQREGTPTEHFDLTPSKRCRAVVQGAAAVTTRELALIASRKRYEASEALSR